MVLTNNEDAFKVPRSMMIISGLWPMEKRTWAYNLRTLTSWIAILALTTTMWMEFLNDLDDLPKLSAIIYILISFMSAIIKQLGFNCNGKTMLKTLHHLKSPIFTDHSEELDRHMKRTAKFSTLLAKTYRFIIGLCVVLIGIFPVIDKKPLPFPFPYDVGNYQVLLYIFQMTCETLAAWNHSSLDTICTSLMGIAAAQLDILSDKIIQIKTDAQFYDDPKERDKIVLEKLKHCVDHHLAIIKLIENIETIFTLGILAQYLASGIIVCNTIFHFILIPVSFQFFMLVNYLICIMTQLYIYCWYGNEIITKTLKIGDACYTFNWYDYGLSVRKYIFIIMERSKRPSCVTALKFTVVSRRSLASILQWSYSMLTLLLNMYKKA